MYFWHDLRSIGVSKRTAGLARRRARCPTWQAIVDWIGYNVKYIERSHLLYFVFSQLQRFVVWRMIGLAMAYTYTIFMWQPFCSCILHWVDGVGFLTGSEPCKSKMAIVRMSILRVDWLWISIYPRELKPWSSSQETTSRGFIKKRFLIFVDDNGTCKYYMFLLSPWFCTEQLTVIFICFGFKNLRELMVTI